MVDNNSVFSSDSSIAWLPSLGTLYALQNFQSGGGKMSMRNLTPEQMERMSKVDLISELNRVQLCLDAAEQDSGLKYKICTNCDGTGLQPGRPDVDTPCRICSGEIVIVEKLKEIS
jgi:DnaJ-class molecular chaperone